MKEGNRIHLNRKVQNSDNAIKAIRNIIKVKLVDILRKKIFFH